MADKIITGLDIGSTAIRVVVGQLLPAEAADRVHIIGAVTVPSRGISRAWRGQALVYLDTVRPSRAEDLLQEALRLNDGLDDRAARQSTRFRV